MWPDSSPARVNKKKKYEQGVINVGDEGHLQKRQRDIAADTPQDAQLFQVVMEMQSSMGLKRGQTLFNLAKVVQKIVSPQRQ